MIDLGERLRKGPLRVRSLFTPRSPAELGRRMLRRRRVFASIDLVVAAACVAFVFAFRPVRVRPELFTRGFPTVAVTRSAVFADGSSAEISDRETELRIEQESVERVVTSLKGAARFDIVPNPARAFEVRTRDVRVRVLGTRFAVQEIAGGQTKISVDRGKVQVEWLGGSRTLVAGESGFFPPTVPDCDLGAALAAREPEVARPVAVEPPSSAPKTARSEPRAVELARLRVEGRLRQGLRRAEPARQERRP